MVVGAGVHPLRSSGGTLDPRNFTKAYQVSIESLNPFNLNFHASTSAIQIFVWVISQFLSLLNAKVSFRAPLAAVLAAATAAPLTVACRPWKALYSIDINCYWGSDIKAAPGNFRNDGAGHSLDEPLKFAGGVFCAQSARTATTPRSTTESDA